MALFRASSVFCCQTASLDSVLQTKSCEKKIKSPRYNSFHKALFSLSIFSENKDAILSLGSHHYCHLLTSEAVEDLMASKAVKTIYLNSNMTPRFWGQNCKFFTNPSSGNSQKRLEHKPNQNYRKMTRESRSHVRILIHRTWAIWSLAT